jgi:hypothetical protein
MHSAGAAATASELAVRAGEPAFFAEAGKEKVTRGSIPVEAGV